MALEAWKNTGNCKECRRAKYCHTQCTANKKWFRKIAELSARSVIGKAMVKDGQMRADEAKKKLAEVRMCIGEDASKEAVDSVFERCKKLATQSRYTVSEIVGGVVSEASTKGKSTEEVLAELEAEYQAAVQKGFA